LRFAVHRPASAVASPRFHGVPRRDVPCRVHISIAGVSAGHAQIEGLALAALLRDMPTRRAAQARESRCYLLDPSRGLVLKATDQEAPAGPLDTSVEASLLGDVPAGSVDGASCRTDHVPDAEVLHADYVEPPRQINGNLLAPIPSPCDLAVLQLGDCGLDLDAPPRPACRLCELPLQRSASCRLTGRETWASQQFPSRQCGADNDTTVNAYDLALARPANRLRQVCERDMPPADLVTSHPIGFHVLRYRTGSAEPHPASLGNLDLGPVPVKTTHITRAHRDDPESFVAPSLPPRWLAVRPSEEPLHRLVVITNRLLLHDYTSVGQPRIVSTGLGQLATPFDPARHSSSVPSPPGFLLYAQVPHVPSMPTVFQQHRLLCGSRLKAITGHANMITDVAMISRIVRNSLPYVLVGRS